MAKRTRSAAERAAQAESLRCRPARGLMLAAAHELALAQGYDAVRVGELAATAGVSRETFYTHFADKRACLAEATSPRLGEVEQLLRVSAEQGDDWAAPLLAVLDEQLACHFGSRAGPRARIMSAMVELVGEGGFAAVRLADLIKRAHVSYPSFYRQFEGKEQCFAATCRSLAGSLRSRVEGESPAMGSSDSPADARATGDSAKIITLAELLKAEPRTARILLIEAGELQARAAVRGRVAAGRGPAPGSASPPASLKDLLSLLLEGEPRPTASTADRAATGLTAGAILEVMREAALHDELQELPGRIASLLLVLGMPSAGQEAQRSPKSRAPRARERRPAPASARGCRASAA